MRARELRAVFEVGMRKHFGAARGDEHLTHVADVKGCNIATHARLLGKPMLQPSPAKLMLFELGKLTESAMMSALYEPLTLDGWKIATDVHLWMQWSDDSVWGGFLNEAAYPTLIDQETGNALDPAITIVGHGDMVATRKGAVLVLEAKSVDKAFPAEAKWADALQSRAYAVMARCASAVGMPTPIVGMIDRRTGEYKFFDVTITEENLDELHRLSIGALASRFIAPPDDYEPPMSWLCKFCDYGECARNQNPERFALQEA